MVRPALYIITAVLLVVLVLAGSDTERERSVIMTGIEAKAKHTNRLVNESSPYLLQHAQNPVDWYPWSDEAFEKARREDKPVFLSVGYSSCHWCHVMERESFENEQIAEILNKHFVSIKVDREERPDVDAIYMQAVQMMTGGGGWPMSVWMTADGKPFYGGTYFPPTDSFGRPGFSNILLTIVNAWHNQRRDLLLSADKISNILKNESSRKSDADISIDPMIKAQDQLFISYDKTYGGFGSAPKFPQPTNLLLLLRHWYRTGDTKSLEMVTGTLDAMAVGGIYDHLGGGFSRYSTDKYWLVPHFEKMLYDQALLTRAYIETYQITGEEKYAKIVREVFDYVLRDMTDEKGGFYSAEDADSEGEEGKFYVWIEEEIDKILGKDAEVFSKHYGVTKAGNFEHGTNILNRKNLEEPKADIQKVLNRAKNKLFKHRAKRIRPNLDDKVITAWNGLMISSMAYGGAVMREKKYIDAAEKAAAFLLNDLRSNGKLRRFYRKGKTVGDGFLEDYSFMILGLLDLYEATYNAKWLTEAVELSDTMIENFSDPNGGFYQTSKEGEKLIYRHKGAYDGAVPSGNSIAAIALLKLGSLTTDRKFSVVGESAIKAYAQQMSGSPLSLTAMLMAVDICVGPGKEIVIVGNAKDSDTKKMLDEITKRYLPHSVIIFKDTGTDTKDIEKLMSFLKQQEAVDNKTTAYVCENFICNQPVTSVDELINLLDAKKANQ